jgi:MFS family permease
LVQKRNQNKHRLISNIFRRKKVFMTGMLFFALASLLAGLAWSIESLFVFRILQGIGIAMIFSTGVAIVTSVFPLDERGRVLGITVASFYCGLSCGPLAGGSGKCPNHCSRSEFSA